MKIDIDNAEISLNICNGGYEDEDGIFIKCPMKMRMMRILLASISQPLNCRSAGVPSGMRPSVCKMDTMMEMVGMMMKMVRTFWHVGTVRHMIIVALS